MKKISILTIILFLLTSCNYINEKKYIDNKNLEDNTLSQSYKWSFSVDWVIVNFESIDNNWWEKLRKIIYSNFNQIVIEVWSSNFLDWIENYKWRKLLIHIWYDIWKWNSIELLNKLQNLELENISINIRDNYSNNNAKNIKTIHLKKEEAILFSKIKSKYKNLGLTIWEHWNWKIICNDEVLEILGIKKEQCFYIQMMDWKAK